ncbi:MAG: hypothetical protein NUV49_00415 [Patescibacteria group bacterium]|nr:hypothetical protein [Patescibacteria group bacterium]
MINLLPLEEKKKVRGEYFARLTITTLYFLFATALIITVFIVSSYISLAAAEQVVRDRLNALASGEVPVVEEFDRIIEETNKKIKILQSGDKDERIYDQVFGTIISHKGDIRITGLLYEKAKDGSVLVRLTGVSPDRESLLAFTRVLEQKSPFTDVEVPVSNFVKERDIEFSMEITLGM